MHECAVRTLDGGRGLGGGARRARRIRKACAHFVLDLVLDDYSPYYSLRYIPSGTKTLKSASVFAGFFTLKVVRSWCTHGAKPDLQNH